MKNKARILSAILGLATLAAPLGQAAAEDIDLFVSSATTASTNPNILIVLDNSSNWSAANQHWPNNMKQGESELRAIRTLINELSDNVNLGMMMMTAGSGSNANGAYPRFHVRQMTTTNKAAFRELIGDSTCTAGSNSLNGTPNCIFKNFDNPEEKIGTSATDYSRTLFEVFKYFGGWTSPALAFSDTQGSPVDSTAGPSATHFGGVRYSGNPDTKADPGAFVSGSSGSRSNYISPIGTNSCAKNYVIVIGNGFPSGDDTNGSILSGVGGTTAQLSMPIYSTTTSTRTDNLTLSDNTTTCRTQNQCQSALSTSYGTGYSSYSCSTNTTTYTTSGCTGQSAKGWTLQGTGSVTATTATGSSAAPTGSKIRYGDEWAKFLYTTDVNSLTGRQYVSTYTIDVFKDAPDGDQNSLLSSMAKYGGGKYFQASSEDAILQALRQIVIEIQSVNSVFASASLPINATNRSQNENQVFIGMFRPDSQARPRWYGNLKRYQVGLFSGKPGLADKNGIEAVSQSTGFIQPCATSFWTSDSSTYWSFASSAGTCTTSSFDKFSDSPDGPLVEKGATAEVIRRGNNPPGTDSTATYALNRTVYTCTDHNSCNCTSGTGCVSSTSGLHEFSTTNVSQSRVGASTTTEHTAIVNYTLGKDVDAENNVAVSGDSTSTNDVRATVHGDVAHSRPLPVNYGGSTGIVLFYGSNDGALRAVRGSDGKELWAFVAPEHHSRLKRLRDNSPIITGPTVSSAITPTPLAKHYFFDGSAGLYETFNSDNSANRVWIFPTMRRGGRMVYGFDVSDINNPRLKWRVGCPNLTDDTDCTTGFTQIGQTWSISTVALIKGYSTTTPVIIMGGGYDSCDDTDSISPSCSGTKGNRVYVINADTGAKLAELSTDRAVAGDVTLVDRNFDGYVDHAYAADTGGNLYRVDFVEPNNVSTTRAAGAWTITKIAQTNVSPAGRKFLFGPSLLPTNDKIYVAITTGDRERPLITNYPYTAPVSNRAYMYVDRFVTTGLPVNLDGSTMLNVNNSTCSTALTSSQDGWYFDLNAGTGEQGVTSSIIFGGLVFFSTNRPLSGSLAACSNNLGEARGYAVNLLNGSGAVGTGNLCGGSKSNTFTGGGLPPSPVTGTVPIGDKLYTIMIGGVDRESGTPNSALAPQPVKPVIAQKRTRIYWYKKTDQ